MIDRSHNLWWATAGQRSPAPALAGTQKCDVAIVGAGIMGCTAAQALAAAGVDVIVLEAGTVGEGASSTPGGFVVPHFSVGAPQTIVDRFGEVGERMVRATGGSASNMFDKIRALGLDCDARQDGWYQPAHSARARERIEDVAAQWQSRGFDVAVFDARETAQRTGVDGYHGSWFAPTGGTIHPLRYCRGLADAAVAAGARLFENSPVIELKHESGHTILDLAHGRVVADRVILCTNGTGQSLMPAMAQSIVPLAVWQCATAPIAPEDRRHLFQGGEALSDTREALFTYRFDIEGRIVTGVMDTFGYSRARQSRAMAKRLQAMLRLPRIPEITHIWSGTASVSAPRYPATLLVDGGVISATACNARGIALSTVTGDSLARYVLTGECPFIPVLERGATKSAALQRSLVRFYPLMGPLLDWADTVRGPSR